MNLPTQLSTSAGVRSFAYIYGQGKYSSGIATASPNPIEETRHYLGGMGFKNGAPEAYNFSDGRIVYEQGQAPKPQFRLADLSRPRVGVTWAIRSCSLKIILRRRHANAARKIMPKSPQCYANNLRASSA